LLRSEKFLAVDTLSSALRASACRTPKENRKILSLGSVIQVLLAHMPASQRPATVSGSTNGDFAVLLPARPYIW
jgi:hypothetical protein